MPARHPLRSLLGLTALVILSTGAWDRGSKGETTLASTTSTSTTST